MSNDKHSRGLAKPGNLYPIYIDTLLRKFQLWLKTPSYNLLIYWEGYINTDYPHEQYPKGFLHVIPNPMNAVEQSWNDHREEYIERCKNILVKELL